MDAAPEPPTRKDERLMAALREMELTSDGFATKLLEAEAERLLIASYTTTTGRGTGSPTTWMTWGCGWKTRQSLGAYLRTWRFVRSS